MSATRSRWWSPNPKREARDAVEAIEVEWSPLAAAIDMREAIAEGAPQVFAEAPGNVAYDAHIGDKAKTDAVFAQAAHVVSLHDRQSARRRQFHGAAQRGGRISMRRQDDTRCTSAARACMDCATRSPTRS